MLAPRSLSFSRLPRFGALAVLNKVTSNLNLKGSGAARSRGREGSALGGFGLLIPALGVHRGPERPEPFRARP